VTTDSPDWFYLVAGQRFGPVDTVTLHSEYQAGRLNRSDLVWADGMAEWLPALKVIDPLAAESPRRLDSQAVWSFVLGLLSVFGLFVFIMLPSAVAGLVLGIRARHSPKRGFAIAGIVLSSLGLLIWIVLLVLVLIVVATIGWDQFMVEILAGLESIQ